jgi:SAM-dependent methyltransferase
MSGPPLSPMATLRWQLVSRAIIGLAPRRVLELGCGQGGYGARIAALPGVERYVGVEPDEQSWTVAHDRIAPLGGEVRLGTSDDVVAPTERFDLVCAFEVIEHLEDDLGALRAWAGHLVPGGAVLVSVPAWPDRFGPMDSLVGHYRRYRPEQLAAALRAAGCDPVTVTAYGWPLGYALEAVRNRIAVRRSAASEMADRSATSGRLLQPRRLAGNAVRVGVAPFAVLQSLRPQAGTGLVGWGVAGAVGPPS